MAMTKPETPPAVAAYFRQFTERRKRTPRACQVCGKTFDGLSWAKFCTQACSSKDARRRLRERLRDAQSEGT
jgi:hypothetical protein